LQEKRRKPVVAEMKARQAAKIRELAAWACAAIGFTAAALFAAGGRDD
jgi:hypothetical protein